MRGRTISDWIRSNIIAFAALFVALSGTALASLPGTNTVDSGDIINGEVQTPDLGADSVTGPKVANGAIKAADVAPDVLGAAQVNEASLDPSVLQRRLANGCAAGSAIRDVDVDGNVTCEAIPSGSGGTGGPPTGPAGGDLTGTYPNPGVAPNAVGSTEVADGALTATDIANNDSLGDAEINQGALDIGIGKTAHDSGFCDDAAHNGEVCGTLNFTLPRPEHVALSGTGEWSIDGFNDPDPGDRENAARMSCVLDVDGTVAGSPVTFGEKQTSFGATPAHVPTFPGTYVLNAITGTLPAGNHVVRLTCTDQDGDMLVEDTRITAITLD